MAICARLFALFLTTQNCVVEQKYIKTISLMMENKAPDAPGQCLINFEGEENEPLTQFTEISFKKVLTNHELWLTPDGEQQEIAVKSSDI